MIWYDGNAHLMHVKQSGMLGIHQSEICHQHASDVSQ